MYQGVEQEQQRLLGRTGSGDLDVLLSIRQHLLEEEEEQQLQLLLGRSATSPTSSCCTSADSPAPSKVYSGRFGNLMPCLNENWGDLPLKVDDSDDMVDFSILRDAVSAGCVPSLGPCDQYAAAIKPEPWFAAAEHCLHYYHPLDAPPLAVKAETPQTVPPPPQQQHQEVAPQQQ